MTIIKKSIIYIYSPDFRKSLSPIIMEQQNIVPICIYDGKKYFYSNGNTLFQEDRVYVKITEAIQGVKPYPIMDLLFKGVFDRNTDIHITTNRVLVKKQGSTSEVINIDENRYQEIKSFLRMFCDLNIFSTKDESTIIYSQFIEEEIGIRVSIFPSEQDSLISLRFMYKNPILCTNHSLSNDLLQIIEAQQLLLIGGVTGRGKTTLMYNLISLYMKNNRDKIIISVEDPVEQIIPNIIQRSLEEEGYGEIIKSVLRHRPDLIVIGEIRDDKAANGLIRALLTGHKIISTIHIIEEGDIYQNIINRMEELGVNKDYLKPYLKCAIVIQDQYKYEVKKFR